MGMFDDDLRYLTPKLGESITVQLFGCTRVDGVDPERGYKSSPSKGNIKYGYWHEFEAEGGKKLICSTWSLYFALKDSKVQPGDTVKIDHPERGVYKVTILKNPEIARNEKGDLDYLKEIEKRNTEVWSE